MVDALPPPPSTTGRCGRAPLRAAVYHARSPESASAKASRLLAYARARSPAVLSALMLPNKTAAGSCPAEAVKVGTVGENEWLDDRKDKMDDALRTCLDAPGRCGPPPTPPDRPRPTLLDDDKVAGARGEGREGAEGDAENDVEAAENVDMVGDTADAWSSIDLEVTVVALPCEADLLWVDDVERAGSDASMPPSFSGILGGGVLRESTNPMSSMAPPSMSVRSWMVPGAVLGLGLGELEPYRCIGAGTGDDAACDRAPAEVRPGACGDATGVLAVLMMVGRGVPRPATGEMGDISSGSLTKGIAVSLLGVLVHVSVLLLCSYDLLLPPLAAGWWLRAAARRS